jgi:hypothetical protein
MKELVDAVASYGLPGWTIIVLGGGAIVAALITALQAIVIAAVNARAARLLAADTAHREHRLAAVKAVLKHVRSCTTLAFEIDGATPGSDDGAAQCAGWLQRLNQLTPQRRTWLSDAELAAALGSFSHSLRRLERALSDCAASGSQANFVLVRKAAHTLKEASAIAEMAAEGYAFGVSRISRQAKRRLQRFIGQRWITWRNHRYFYWPPLALRRQWSSRATVSK